MRLSFPAALTLSFLAHVALLVELPGSSATRLSSVPSPLRATLMPPEAPPAPPLDLPDFEETQETPKPPVPPKPRPPALAKRSAPRETFSESANRQLKKLARREDFYPRASIAAGEQGQALVLVFLDEKGNVIAARIEESSGFPRLDEAALRAAYRLKNLPGGLPEGLLPVRFRLE
ncbi:MAG: energy transducer TonB [Zoogloeaceae bacterium]|jgi:protein TonB|nr:energy transducer TonB [Zoogloeaceae bacterium]